MRQDSAGNISVLVPSGELSNVQCMTDSDCTPTSCVTDPDFPIIKRCLEEKDPALFYLHFGASKSSYRNALNIIGPSDMRTSNASQTCDMTDPSSMALEEACFFNTQNCAIDPVCDADPNKLPGEVSCYCKKDDSSWSISPRIRAVPPGTGQTFELGLLTDYNGDLIRNQRRSSEYSNNSSQGGGRTTSCLQRSP